VQILQSRRAALPSARFLADFPHGERGTRRAFLASTRMTLPHQHRILLVEDQEHLRRGVAELLRMDGHEVIEASDGQGALLALHGEPEPCLVLLDLQLPDMSGREVRLQQLRDPRLAKIPTVALSGHGGVAQQARALGMSDFIAKPIDLDKLTAVLRHVCRQDAGSTLVDPALRDVA
jgi:CheY-like chemotaxis protein